MRFLGQNSHFNIEIQGHTDDIGTDEANDELSYRRALAVFNYLISQGVKPGRMSVIGFGESKPLYPNDTEEHRALTRRIEVVFKTEE